LVENGNARLTITLRQSTPIVFLFLYAGSYLGGGTGRHMPRGVKSQKRQNILEKLILKMMYLMKQ
jgi:hypothetical protein